jgi:NADH-quinone oxidoreductase subunit H
MKLGFFLFAEYTNMFISSAVIATLYFGGYHVPGLDKLGLDPNLATLIGAAAMFAKTFFFIFFFMWVRWSTPRFRFDQLMNLGLESADPAWASSTSWSPVACITSSEYF